MRTAVIEVTNAARTTLVRVDVRVCLAVWCPRLVTESVLGQFDDSSRIPSPSDSYRQTLQQWGKIDGVESARTESSSQRGFRFTEDIGYDQWNELLTHAVIGLELGSRRLLGKEGSLTTNREKDRRRQPDQTRAKQWDSQSGGAHDTMITKPDARHQSLDLRTLTGRSSRRTGGSTPGPSKRVTTSTESGSPASSLVVNGTSKT